MDDITTRAIVIGVNIFVTLAIVSIIIVMFFQMMQIYGTVRDTDTSIYTTFNNITSMYSGRTMNGLGLLNTIKKYENKTDENIIIIYPGSNDIKEYVSNNNLREASYLKSLMESNKDYSFEKKYDVVVEEIEQDKIAIIFNNAE